MVFLKGDLNPLFALQALNLGLLRKEEMVQAMQVWAQEKSISLPRLFLRQGLLTIEQVRLLQSLNEQTQTLLNVEQIDPDRLCGLFACFQRVAGDLSRIRDTALNLWVEQFSQLITRARKHQKKTHTIVPTVQTTNEYLLVSPFASGAYSHVFIAQDRSLYREVVLKELQINQAEDLSQRQRLLAEAEIHAQLEHSSIPPVYTKGCHDDGRPFFVMRWIRGQLFTEVIRQFHQGEPPRLERWNPRLRYLLRHLIQVAQAIAYAHMRGVGHCDLKPDNVVVNQFGEAMVLDWGLAIRLPRPEETPTPQGTATAGVVQLSDETAPGTVGAGGWCGTPGFMSPEQLQGRTRSLTAQTDIFGLGAILYAILTNVSPFAGESIDDILLKTERFEMRLPHQQNPGVDRELEAICLKALHREPKQRYASVADFIQDLEDWLGDRSIQASRASVSILLLRWLRQNPLVALATLICSLITVTSAGITLSSLVFSQF